MSSESSQDSDASVKTEEEDFTYGYYCAKCEKLYCSTNVHHDLGLDGKFYCFECYWFIKRGK